MDDWAKTGLIIADDKSVSSILLKISEERGIPEVENEEGMETPRDSSLPETTDAGKGDLFYL